MFDSCRRDIHYLRLSVTDRCNLRCRYCMPDGAKIPEHEEVLTHDEFLRLAGSVTIFQTGNAMAIPQHPGGIGGINDFGIRECLQAVDQHFIGFQLVC